MSFSAKSSPEMIDARSDGLFLSLRFVYRLRIFVRYPAPASLLLALMTASSIALDRLNTRSAAVKKQEEEW